MEEIVPKTPPTQSNLTPSIGGVPIPNTVPNAVPNAVLNAVPNAVPNTMIASVIPTNVNASSPGEVFEALLNDLAKVSTQGQAGELILQAKDVISKKIQFNSSYFEMLMFAGPLKAKKGIPITPEIIKLCQDKIALWRSKF
jgi:hypothetical protein